MHSKQTKKERVIPNKNIHPSIHQFSKQICFGDACRMYYHFINIIYLRNF